MRAHVLAVIAGSLALLPSPPVVVAQTAVSQTTLQEPNQRTAEISTDELRRILADRSSLVLDARPFMEYAVSHVPSALNAAPKAGVPMSLYVSDVKEVERLVAGDRTKSLVLYCNGPFCGKSKRLSEELLEADSAAEDQVVVVDREGDGGGVALGVDAEDHRDRPLPVVEDADPPRRLLAGAAHLLQRLGPPVAVDQSAERGVVLRRVAEAVGLDRPHDGVEIVFLRVLVPAPGLGERDVAKLEAVGARL